MLFGASAGPPVKQDNTKKPLRSSLTDKNEKLEEFERIKDIDANFYNFARLFYSFILKVQISQISSNRFFAK